MLHKRNRQNPKNRFNLLQLDERITPAVYYFNGGNLFGPQNNPFDGNDWRNPYNWGKDDNGTVVVNQGIPGQGDLAIFKGSTADGKAWQLASGHKDSKGNYDEFVATFGRSVKIDSTVAVSILKVDTTYQHDLFTSNGQGSITATNGLLQAGNFGIKLTNEGAIDIATASNGIISFANTLTNHGTINFTGGNARFDIPQANGSFAGGTLINPNGSTITMAGDALITRGTFQNDGLVITSGNNQVSEVNLQSSKTAEYRINSGDMSFPVSTFAGGISTFENGKFTVQPAAKLHFSGSGIRIFIGDTKFQGGGYVEINMHGQVSLDHAVFTTANNTTFEVNGGFDNRAGATRFTGTGGLAADSMMTVSNAVFSASSFTNNGTIRFGATNANPSPDNNIFGIIDGSQLINNGQITLSIPQFPITNGQLLNRKSGTVEFTNSTTVNGGNGLIFNEGTIRTTPSAGTQVIRPAFDNFDGTLDIQGGTVSIPSNQGPDSGGSTSDRAKLFAAFGLNRTLTGVSVGGTFNVATGATLDLRAPENLFALGAAYAGSFKGTGGGKVLLGGEIQMRNADWNFAPGMLRWEAVDNNTSRIYGDWTNHSDLTLASTANNSALTLMYGTLINVGTINVLNNTRIELNNFPSFSRLINNDTATIHFGSSVTMNGSGPGVGLRDIYDVNGAFFENKGLVTFSGDANLNAIVDNNAGTFETLAKSNIGIGYFRAIHPDLVQLSIGGTWIARNGSSFNFSRLNNGNPSQAAPLTFRGNATVDGVNSSLPWLSTIANQFGTITVLNGANITLGNQGDPATNNLTNSGKITMNGGTITVPGNFTQTAKGVLTTIVDNKLTQLSVGKTAALGGLLTTAGSPGFTPADTDRFDVVVAKNVLGTFAKQSLNGYISQITPTTVTLAPASQAIDLAVSNVKILPANTTTFSPGSPFSIQFTVRNLTNNAITSKWNDAVFISEDNNLDSSDTLLGRLTDLGGLAPFESRIVTIPLTTPAIPGSWSIIVATDSQAALFDANRVNNIAIATDPLNISYSELPFGVDVTAVFPAGDTTYYRLTLAPGTGPVRITANSANDNATQISARLGEIPLGAADDLIGNSIVIDNGRTATIDLPDSQAGVYFIAVKRTVGSAVILHADVQSLLISGFDNPNLSSELRANDTLQLVVRGSGFTPASVFKLGNTIGTTTFVNASTAIVNFVVPESTSPLFVSVTNSSNQYTILTKPFTVHVYQDGTLRGFASYIKDQMPNWHVQIEMPAEVRPFREVHATVTFQNNSTFSQPAPLLQLFASNSSIRLLSQSTTAGKALEVLGVKTNGGDRYAPGEVGSFEVILIPEVTQIHTFFDLNATVIEEQNYIISPSTIINPNGGRIEEVPLSSILIDQFRLTTHSQNAWEQTIRPRLLQIIGTTSRSYSDALRNAARVLQLDGADAHDVSRLNNYLINLADDFGRVQERYTISAFGRGRSNPFDIHIETDVEGNKLVFIGNESRPFMKIGDQFLGLSGDRGNLTLRTGGWLLTEADGTIMAFRTDGKLEYVQDLVGRRTTYNYTSNQLTSIIDFKNDTTSFIYNSAGRITSITNAVGIVTTFGYDSTGELLTSVTNPTGTTTYDYAGTTGVNAFALTGVTGPDGIRYGYNYTDGQLVSTTQAGQTLLSFKQGLGAALGQLTITDATGNISTGLIGEFGQITRQVDALGRVTDAVVNANGQTTMVTSPQNSTVRTPVDANGNVTSIVDTVGNRTRIGYDANGVLSTTIHDPLGKLTAFEYNDANQLVAQADSQGSVQYSYDSTGNLVGTVSNGSRSIATTYNSKNLPIRRDYGDGTYTTYEYDSHRNLTKITDFGVNGSNPKPVIMTYDVANRVTGVAYANGTSVAYRYDQAGRVDRITPSNSAVIEYAYDSLGRMSTLSRGGVVEVTYGYDTLNRLTTKSFVNGTSSVTTYDTLSRITRIEHRRVGSVVLDFQAYEYNTQNQIISLTTPDGITKYGYDLVGQLTSITAPSGTVETYTYDAAGNRIGYTANSANQYTTTPTGGAFTYDSDGNLTTRTGENGLQTQTQYTYDTRGRLIAENGTNGVFQYEYDALGNRSAVIQNGVRTDLLVDPSGLGNVLSESIGGNVTASYLVGANVEGRFDSNGSGSFYHVDAQGSVNRITDSSGAVSASYRYSAFGTVLSQSGTAAASNVYRFNGAFGVADRGNGLLDMRNRFYDSTLGRFTQRDPIGIAGQDTNDYRFVKNNPISFNDPSGLFYGIGYMFNTPSNLAYTSVLTAARTAFPVISNVTSTVATNLAADAGLPLLASASGGSPLFVTSVTADGTSVLGTFAPTVERMVFTDLAADGTVISTPAAASAGSLFAAAAIPAATTASVIAGFELFGNRGRGIENAYSQNDNTALKPAGYSERLRTNSLNDTRIRGYIDDYRRSNNGDFPSDASLLLFIRGLRGLDQSNLANVQGEIRVPHDPNDIVGPQGYGPQGFLNPVGDFGYTIRFQNQPTATAPAQVVTITQQLDSDLNWDSFQLQSFGWADYQFNVPSGLQSYHTRIADTARNAIVDVRAEFNAATGMLTWTLTTLDPTTLDQPADSVAAGFLPPDDASGRGQGFVSYTIQPKANSSTGTRFDAQARIVFDTESPINTPVIYNTADRVKPTVTVNTLPANSPSTSVTVSLTGQDDVNGSGVATYNVYTSVNGGSWTPWLTDSTLTSSTYTGTAGQTVSFYAVNSDNVGLVSTIPTTAQASTILKAQGSNPVLVGFHEISVSSDNTIKTYNSNGTPRLSFTPFTGFNGGVRTTSADFNGDGVADIVVGTGPGVSTHVKIFDGVTQTELFSIDPFEASFTGGVFVAAGDMNGDGIAELAITPDDGGGPRVRVFSGNGFSQIADFYGIEDPQFRGGARVAIGDLNGDGQGDLIVAAGVGGGPRVAAYDGAQLGGNGGPKLFNDFYTFESTLRNGIFVAVGDVNGDGFADIVAGAGNGGGPRVFILDGNSLVQTGSSTIVSIGNFFAGDINSRSGVRVAIKNLDNDAKADVVTGSGQGAGSRVTAYLGTNISATSGTPSPALDFDAFADFAGGVFVG